MEKYKLFEEQSQNANGWGIEAKKDLMVKAKPK